MTQAVTQLDIDQRVFAGERTVGFFKTSRA